MNGLAPGKEIRDYVVVERLRAGGKSQVAKATRGADTYFVKSFLTPRFDTRPATGPHAEAVRKSQATCTLFADRHNEIMRRLSSVAAGGGNLVKPTEFFRVKSTYYKVYPFLVAESSSALVTMSPEAQDVFVKTLVLSVRELHSVDIVHGDIKLDNVMLQRNGDVAIAKLIDFDEAYLSGEPPASRMGGDDVYLSPEVDRYLGGSAEPAELTVQADMFSLGIVLYRILTGEGPPVVGGTGTNVAEHIASGGRIEAGPLAHMSSTFSSLVAATLLLDPFDRPTIDDLSDELGLGRLRARAHRAAKPEVIDLVDHGVSDPPPADPPSGLDPAPAPAAATGPTPVVRPSGVRHTMRQRDRT